MKTRIIILFIITLSLLFTGCVNQEQENQNQSEITTSIPGTAITTLPAETTTITTETTTIQANPPTSTTTTRAPLQQENPGLAECKTRVNQNEIDICYLNMAIATNNRTICSLIERSVTKSMCIEKTGVETDGTSTRIRGYVFNITSGQPIPRVTVSVVSMTFNKTIDTMRTNSRGIYETQVPSRDTYRIILEIGEKYPAQTVFARKNWVHELNFNIN